MEFVVNYKNKYEFLWKTQGNIYNLEDKHGK